MREFKFRAWGPHLSVMSNNIEHLDSLNEYLSSDRYIVMQYTGLKDNDDVDIYEGDVVAVREGTNTHRKIEVTYLDGCFMADDEIILSHFISDTDFTYTVIGNIHENPELLK